jgi:hypothetical protein
MLLADEYAETMDATEKVAITNMLADIVQVLAWPVTLAFFQS